MKEEIQLQILKKGSFETTNWLNTLLFEVLCTSKSRLLIDSDQEALLAALTRISREAIESKLSDYQRESWLFLSNLDLQSFSFGDRLPLIQNVKISYYKQGNFALVMDISYSGGIRVGLKAAVAVSSRDFSASINFNPSKFKFIMKLDAEPTPRISFMLSDLPAYEMAVTMRSQQLDRASNLIKTILGNFIRNRICFPNYMTILFPQKQAGPFAQIANSKQFQSQLRVRLVSVNLNPEHPVILPFEELNVTAIISLAELSCKTEIINAELRNTRWNSIHTFNIFNGLESSPKILQISLYQVLDSNSMNQIGRIEIPYVSIAPGLLDIRTLSLSTDPNSTISLEMYLHHMEEDGDKDSNWIFWNCPKPPKRKAEQEQKIEQVNWDTIKFIISKLSSDHNTEEDHLAEIEVEADDNLSTESESDNHITHLFDLITKLLNKTINRLARNNSYPQVVDILNAFRFELDDFSTRFNLSRPALSIQALPAHNARLATLLRPLIKTFVPEAFKMLCAEHCENEEIIGKALRDLSRIQELVSNTRISNIETTNDSSPDLLNEFPPQINLSEFKGFIGDQAVKIEIDEENGLKITKTAAQPDYSFDLEGIFYTNTTGRKSHDLGSLDLFNDFATWEISLLKDRYISFVPLGQSHLYPNRVIDLKEIVEIEMIKDRNAFTLGFNADLSAKEALKHANNGLLRLSLRDGEKLDLFGESRTCDQWYCIISSRITEDDNFTISWKDLNKLWLLPLNLPFLSFPYALALQHESLTHLIISNDIYRAYCKIKTIWLGKRELLGFDLYKNSSSSSLTSSPQSQKSKSSFIFSSSSSVSTRQDPFASRTKYDRLIMSTGKTRISDSTLFMQSIEDLKQSRNNQWTFSITEGAAIFNCSLSNFPSGYISIGPEFICYWTTSLNSVSGLPLQNQHILLLPRDSIQEISKTLPNWVTSFSGLILRLKKKASLPQDDPIIITGFENNQELELIYDILLGIN